MNAGCSQGTGCRCAADMVHLNVGRCSGRLAINNSPEATSSHGLDGVCVVCVCVSVCKSIHKNVCVLVCVRAAYVWIQREVLTR